MEGDGAADGDVVEDADGQQDQLHYTELRSMTESDSSSLGPTTSSDEENNLLQEAGRLINDGTGVSSASRSSSASSAQAGPPSDGSSGGERLLPRDRGR